MGCILSVSIAFILGHLDQQDQLNMGFNATLEVLTTRELKVCGMIGHGVSAKKKHECVAETEIGIGGTNAWKFCSITPKTTAAVYFEVVNQVSARITQNYVSIIL